MDFRIEKDTMGDVKVPANRYWGAQTERSRNNFKIGPEGSMPIEIIHAFAYLKKAAAQANCDLGVLAPEKSVLISRVCDEIIAGKHNDEFPLVIWQTGSGTQSNMNCNEVIANRGHEISGGKLTDETKVLNPNDDVNKSQSSNDTFPTAMHIAAYKMVAEKTLPGLEHLRNVLQSKVEEFRDIVKTGRTHFMDATPLTLGQEFSAYVCQIDKSIRCINNALEAVSELAL
ncbi:MAG: class fumarate hydratase, partial [Bacteroidota bacterium]